MRRFLIYFVLIPLALIGIALAVANRHAVVLSFDPFNAASPALSVSVPLFVLLFATLAIGVIIGGAAAWFRQGRWRRQARSERVEADRLRREVERRKEIPALPTRDAA
ncbi:MAG: LapA family protein [Bauldia sp.]|nr:LapA family protein [Bauldia sp.]